MSSRVTIEFHPNVSELRLNHHQGRYQSPEKISLYSAAVKD